MTSIRPNVTNNVVTEATRRPTRVPRQRPVRDILPRVVTMAAICVTVAGVRVYTVMIFRVVHPSEKKKKKLIFRLKPTGPLNPMPPKAALVPVTVLDSTLLSGLLTPRGAGGGALREGAAVSEEGERREG